MNESLCILAGWLIDGTGGPIRRDVVVQVVDGMIVNVKKTLSIQDALSAPHTMVVDLSHCTLLPGLVDSHVHLTMSGTSDPQIRQRQLSFTFDQAESVISMHLEQHLFRGIVAVRDGGDAAAHTLRYKNERLPSEKLPIHVKCAGKAWRARGRYGRLIGRPPEDGSTLAQCIMSRERRGDHVKVVNSGLNSLTQFGKETLPQFSPEELEAAVQACRKHGLKVMVHANGALPVRVAVDAGCHSIEHGFFMGTENLERMAELQVFWAPTTFSMRAYAGELPAGSLEVDVSMKNLEHQLKQLTHARRLGIPVVVGTDCGSLGIHHGSAFAEELKLFMEAGFSVPEAIQCATFEGARLLGMENELGQLKRGMPATFVALRGDPSSLPDSLSNPESVYVRGCPMT